MSTETHTSVGGSDGMRRQRLNPDRRHMGDRAILHVDEKGVVRSCNQAAVRLFDPWVEEVLGRSIAGLSPDLPLRESTPGYNVAYMRFWSAARTWRHFPPTVRRGRSEAVELQFKPAERMQDNAHAWLVEVRRITK